MIQRLMGVLLVILAMATPVFAQEQVITDDMVNEVASQMYCTECENIPLDVCGTQACIQWREEIRTQLAEGRTAEEIMEYFRVNHGERALGTPRDPALRFMALATPYIAVALAVLATVVFLYRWQRRTDAAPQTSAPAAATGAVDDDYLNRLERDLGT